MKNSIFFQKLLFLSITSLYLFLHGTSDCFGSEIDKKRFSLDWDARYIDPKDEIEFVGLGIANLKKDEVWIVVKRYPFSLQENKSREARFQLWHFISGKRINIFKFTTLSASASFKGLHVLDSGKLAIAFVNKLVSPIILFFDPSQKVFLKPLNNIKFGEQVSSVDLIELHNNGGFTLSGVQKGLPVIIDFDPKHNENWRYESNGLAGEFVSIWGFENLREEMLAVVGNIAKDPTLQKKGREASLGFINRFGKLVLIKKFKKNKIDIVHGVSKDGVTIILGRIKASSAVTLQAYAPVKIKKIYELKTKKESVLPTKKSENELIEIKSVCRGQYVYADRENSKEFGHVIRFSIFNNLNNESSITLYQKKFKDYKVLSDIALYSKKSIVYVASTIVKIEKTRELRKGVEFYRLSVSNLCGK